MKRVLAVVLLLGICLFAFAGCGRKKELDHKSILNIETKEIISIGDDKKDIDKLLGDSTYDSESGMYVYCDETIWIRYFEGEAIIIFTKGEDTFEILGYKVGMSEAEVAKNLESYYGEDAVNDYGGYYDNSGNRCVEDLASYVSGVRFEAGKVKNIFVTKK